MDIKTKIEELVNKIKSDKNLLTKFKENPTTAIEGIIGIDLPDDQIEKIVEAGINAGQIKKGNAKVIASEIYGLIASTLVYKMKNQEEISVQ